MLNLRRKKGNTVGNISNPSSCIQTVNVTELITYSVIKVRREIEYGRSKSGYKK